MSAASLTQLMRQTNELAVTGEVVAIRSAPRGRRFLGSLPGRLVEEGTPGTAVVWGSPH
jgi:hypothetical protein